MANHSSRPQRVPREHPHCPFPADDSHGSARAGRKGCICHGALEKAEADNERRRRAQPSPKNRLTPRQFDHCPVSTSVSHGTVRAARQGCICHDGQEKLDKETQRRRDSSRAARVSRTPEQRRADSAREWQRQKAAKTHDPVRVGGRPTPVPAITAAELRVWEQRDKPCEFEDPELFTVVGEGLTAAYQARVAKRVCEPCPVKNECLLTAFKIGDEINVRGGTTPAERRAMRRHGIGAVAS